jgi:maltose alpha-D-glucosyltransferase/alpha-amylase
VTARILSPDPLWYKDAIVYELRVRSFYDGDGDGIGDFRGLLEKLDYLQDLGVTALWLLPFYPSPLRDDGYDISDYTDVHPEYGTLADFERFLAEAHRRGLRVITELVLNHTSDQHRWFQRARRAPPGSPEREKYVWSDTPDRYREARIIFKDYEPSNWSWDPVARAYFWHRFYAHQPDLNFDNPAVHRALLEVVDFWLDRGVDGLRLDAVPYLYEREGTASENLPETHAFLRELRAHVDARHEGRMLLAEANQWPEDAAAYFGRGDECHMAFHFPIMPRIFMSLHLEDRFPLVDILAQTPELDPRCQWALFLRNHDELTLEMVTDEERDAMYRAYAAEPVMRLNLGIRRRLAPLLGSDRRNIELVNALLLSLPGTPVLYYGDEIGMGDNVFLGDRDGVRTPMQWSADKNAGFSRANPQRLILPVIIDPAYHYEAINVETQQENPSSLLWWTKRLIALRKRHRAFGRGSIEFLGPENPRVLAFVRVLDDEIILVVGNLSRLVQSVELDLARWKGLCPVELSGQSELPVIGEAPYPLTLGGHAFYWLSLERPGGGAFASGYEPPSIEDASLGADHGAALAEVLAGYVAARRWSSGPARPLEGASLSEVVPVSDPPAAHVVLVRIERAGAEPERFVVPLLFASGERAAEIRARSPSAIVAQVRPRSGEHGVLVDAFADGPSTDALIEAMSARGRLPGRAGEVVVSAWPVLGGERVLCEPLRRLDDGPSPGLEIARFLAEGPPLPAVPPLAGAIEYRPRRGEPITLALLRPIIPSEGDAWSHAVEAVRRFYERALAELGAPPEPPPRDLLRLAGEEPPERVRVAVGGQLDTANLLGRRTAELHLALASRVDRPAFAPEPTTIFDQRSTYQSMRNLAGRCWRLLRVRARRLPPDAVAPAQRVLALEAPVLRRFEALLGLRVTAQRTRLHGAWSLGKALWTGNDFIVADLEGDRSRPLSERRRKASPLRDAASMIRSLHAAAWWVLLDPARTRPEDVEAARPWADLWWAWVSAAFLRGYLEAAGEASFLPRGREELAVLLDAFLLESALAELAAALEAGGDEAAARRELIALELVRELAEGR